MVIPLVFWLVVYLPLWKIWSQLGWLFPIYGKIKIVRNHQPVFHQWENNLQKNVLIFPIWRFPDGGTHCSSSIYRWDFPWNQPSSDWEPHFQGAALWRKTVELLIRCWGLSSHVGVENIWTDAAKASIQPRSGLKEELLTENPNSLQLFMLFWFLSFPHTPTKIQIMHPNARCGRDQHATNHLARKKDMDMRIDGCI